MAKWFVNPVLKRRKLMDEIFEDYFDEGDALSQVDT